MMTGLVSVTFRKKTPAQIIALAAQAGLGCIEWGGDVHVPPGDTSLAIHVRALTEEAGLQVSSYGSYYRLLEHADPAAAFAPVLESAAALGAPVIRIWAGGVSPAQANDHTYAQAAEELRVICAMAKARGIGIALEYHRNTLTQTAESALRLLAAANCDNLSTYWQPNPELTHAQNLAELRMVLPHLSYVHVFYWRPDGEKLPLAEGAALWRDCIALAPGAAFLLEFVKDDSEAAYLRDAETLSGWTA